MRFTIYLFLAVIMLLFSQKCNSANQIRIMFYNVENFFDCDNDSLKLDEEFLPGGIRGWTPSRFWKKAGNISRVLAVAGKNGFPEIVGMAEVENDKCLNRLVKSSPLKNAGYSFIHYESPDIRGIDVCMLYNPYVFTPLQSEPIQIIFSEEPQRKTRDILYVCGKVYSADTLHIYICHFPSRLGGELETDDKRQQVAGFLRTHIDSVLNIAPNANIVIMGDFNDTPLSPSIKDVIGAVSPEESILKKAFLQKEITETSVTIPPKETIFTKVVSPITTTPSKLYNMMLPKIDETDTGTHKNQSEWALLDHIIISENLLDKASEATIFKPDFLLTSDQRWLGIKPFRTYHGMKYQGGYSDHLPVFIDLNFISR